MRGKGLSHNDDLETYRITPAYAGKSKEQWQAFLTE